MKLIYSRSRCLSVIVAYTNHQLIKKGLTYITLMCKRIERIFRLHFPMNVICISYNEFLFLLKFLQSNLSICAEKYIISFNYLSLACE